ncbi:hypothetical protein [Devosia nitrariae]|uniref:HEAT repeat domain-containing protein n=1 Tax=Devosia nitrariae TaxID=2071872 RepID=A0ABQ5W100_9HYPH|nr:hypothetical protein [Devosia nitrariae]GLQ53572.1 hypothetical protein GCM10010862_08310 [Devosia nitrariae]
MVIRDADREVARRMYHVAVGIVAMRDDDIAVREAAVDAVRMPSPATIRALLAVGREKEWLASVVDALAEVGIAAAEEVLGDENE